MKSDKPQPLKPSESHRLLVGRGRYIVFEKQFSSDGELRDWLAINTLLSDENIERLFAEREIEFDEGGKPEWYKYLRPLE